MALTTYCDRRTKGLAHWSRHHHYYNSSWSNVPFLFLLTLLPASLTAAKVDEQKLMDAILADYTTAARPVYNASQKVTVKFGLTLTQISDMDEVNQVLTINVWLEQEWQDERLTWEPQDFNGLSILRIPCEKLWLPDIVLYNSADDFTTGYMKSKAMVTSTGNVFWPPPAKFRSSCKIDITYFPFDDQVCELKFGSWTYDGFQVDITNRSAKVDLTNYVFSGEWELIDVRVRRTEMYYACCKEPYPDVRFTIIIRRKTLYYLFNIIFPCLWLTILSLLGFWLPPDSGEKITLGITVLLAFSVFMLLIAESMPATSEFVPLIGIYLTVTMAMTSLSIILTVFVLQLHHVGPHQKRVPRWMWTLVLDILAPMVCLCHVKERYRYLTARLNKSDDALLHQVPQQGTIAFPENKRQDVHNTRGGDSSSGSTACGAGGRIRGNCNGIIVTGSKASGMVGIGREGMEGVSANSGSEGGGYPGLRGSGGNIGTGGPHNEGAVPSRGSGSIVTSVASSVHSTLLTSHNEDSRGQQVANSGAEQSSSRRAPARKDPRWRPAEYVNCRAGSLSSVDSPQRARPAASDGVFHRLERGGDTHEQGTVPLTTVSPTCSLPSTDDLTHAKFHQLQQEGICETSLASFKDRPLTPLAEPPEKPPRHRPETVSSGRLQGEAPPAYHSPYVQRSANAPEAAMVQDYYVLPGSTPAQVQRRSQQSKNFSRSGKNVQKEQVTQHLEVLVNRDNEDDYHQDVVTEWRVVAHVMDRLLFWLFLLVAIVSSVIILIIKPLTKPEKWRDE